MKLTRRGKRVAASVVILGLAIIIPALFRLFDMLERWNTRPVAYGDSMPYHEPTNGATTFTSLSAYFAVFAVALCVYIIVNGEIEFRIEKKAAAKRNG